MQTYVAFLRGINVGGNALIKMADLKECLARHGLKDVRTYIHSGNVIFQSAESDTHTLGSLISAALHDTFEMLVAVAVFTADEWQDIIRKAPEWWGTERTWKHNILILTEPITPQEVIKAIGSLKPDIEAVQAGDRVVYQSMSFTHFGKTTSGKLASSSVYKQMTVRNYSTATKLAALLENNV